MSSSDESSASEESEGNHADCSHADAPTEGTSDSVSSESVSTPSDAFQVLGNEIRMGILETMLERRDDADVPDRMRFSELFETTDLETTAQFAYHLEQLVGPYLRKVPHADSTSPSPSKSNSDRELDSEPTSSSDATDGRTGAGYELTYAGLKIARAIAAGAYTRRVDHPSIALEEACPFCETDGLEAHSSDNVVTIECTACERPLLRLQFPPSGLEAHGRREQLPTAFDRHYRHRLALMQDGVCPECGGSIQATLAPAVTDAGDGFGSPTDRSESSPEHNASSKRVEDERSGNGEDGGTDIQEDCDFDRFLAAFACSQCGHELRCPVTLSVLEHPAVISFYHEHDRSIRDRPIWNVGREWTETVLSRDPVCVRVVTELEDEVLALYVDASLRVVEVQRAEGRDGADRRRTDDGSADSSDESLASDTRVRGRRRDDENGGEDEVDTCESVSRSRTDGDSDDDSPDATVSGVTVTAADEGQC